MDGLELYLCFKINYNLVIFIEKIILIVFGTFHVVPTLYGLGFVPYGEMVQHRDYPYKGKANNARPNQCMTSPIYF